MNWQDKREKPPLDDNSLALALKEGDMAAFDELVRRHQSRVYSVAYRITANREDALDVAQEAFLKVYSKIGGWQPTGGFLPWLLRLTTNQALDVLRRRRRRGHEPLEDAGAHGRRPLAREPAVRDAEQQVRAHEVGAYVLQALNVLSPAQRAVFVLRHYEGMQLSEIASALGCTVGSVKVHLFRSLKKLQKELQELKR